MFGGRQRNVQGVDLNKSDFWMFFKGQPMEMRTSEADVESIFVRGKDRQSSSKRPLVDHSARSFL